MAIPNSEPMSASRRVTPIGRRPDRDRILRLLLKEGGQLSNPTVKTRLNLSVDRYDIVRRELINAGLVEVYRCKGGGIRLTPQGKDEALQETDDTAENNEEVWTGTGFFVSRYGHVLTKFSCD